MRVEGPKSTPTSGKARKASTGGAQFALPDADPAPVASGGQAAAQTSAVQGLDAILALQSVETAGDRARRAVRHGHDLLDQLEALRADLLAGHISPQRVGALLGLLRAKQGAEDTQLAALIDDIDLRARVELAKLGIEP
jgi:hypothetical protein